MTWTVLLVDDSRTIHEVVRMTLINTDFRLITAITAEEGFELAKEEKPAVILADVRMPGMDGYELCALVKEEESTQSIPVLLLAGLNVEQDVKRSKDVRAMGFFPKPFDTQELLDQLTMLCQASSPDMVPDARGIEMSEYTEDAPEAVELVLEEPEDIFGDSTVADADVQDIQMEEEWAEIETDGLIATDEVVQDAKLESADMPTPLDEYAATAFEEVSVAKPREPEAAVVDSESDFVPEFSPVLELDEVEDGGSEPIKLSDEEAEFLLEEIDDSQDIATDFDEIAVEAGEKESAVDEFGFTAEPLEAAEVAEELEEEVQLEEFVEEIEAEEPLAAEPVLVEEAAPELEVAAAELSFEEIEPEEVLSEEVVADELAAEEILPEAIEEEVAVEELAVEEVVQEEITTEAVEHKEIAAEKEDFGAITGVETSTTEVVAGAAMAEMVADVPVVAEPAMNAISEATLEDDIIEDEDLELDSLEMDESELEELEIEEDLEFETLEDEILDDMQEPLDDPALLEEIESDYLVDTKVEEPEEEALPEESLFEPEDKPLFEEISAEPTLEAEPVETLMEEPLLEDEILMAEKMDLAEPAISEADEEPLIEEIEEDTVTVKPEVIEEGTEVTSLADLAPKLDVQPTEESAVMVAEAIKEEDEPQEPAFETIEETPEVAAVEEDSIPVAEEIIEEPDQAPIEEAQEEVAEEPQETPEVTTPGSEDILQLFRVAIREELALMQPVVKPAEKADLGADIELQMREAVRQEVKAAFAEKELESLGEEKTADSAIDPVELRLIIKESIKEEMQKLMEDNEDETDLKDDIISGISAEFEKQSANLEMPVMPAVPTAEEVAAELMKSLQQPLEEIQQSLKKLESLDQLGGQVNTWINSALSELPDAEEVTSIVAKALSGASLADGNGTTASASFDVSNLRAAMREEFGGMAGQTLEAVAWEVVPDLAEQIIKKELDRLVTEKV